MVDRSFPIQCERVLGNSSSGTITYWRDCAILMKLGHPVALKFLPRRRRREFEALSVICERGALVPAARSSQPLPAI
jgi:hypothetical protein